MKPAQTLVQLWTLYLWNRLDLISSCS